MDNGASIKINFDSFIFFTILRERLVKIHLMSLHFLPQWHFYWFFG